MMIMFWTLYEANKPAIRKTNSMGLCPINILERRLNSDDEAFLNPYEVNLNAVREVYDKLKLLEM